MKLSQICKITNGIGNLKTTNNIPAESISCIKPGESPLNKSSLDYVNGSANIVREGLEIMPKESLIMAASGKLAGSIKIQGVETLVEKNVIQLTFNTQLIKSKFICYYLGFKKNMFVKLSKYGLHVSCRNLQNLDIHLPSLKEQAGIVTHLDIYLSKIFNTTRHTTTALKKIDFDKQQVLNKIFSCYATDSSFTEGHFLKLKDCGIVKAGRTPNSAIRDYYGSAYPLFKPADLCQGAHVRHSKARLTFKGLKEAGYVKENSLIICSNGINLGNVGITGIEGACNQQMISFMPDSHLIPEFVYFQMMSDNFKKQLQIKSGCTAVSKSAFADFYLAVPDLECQQRIIDSIKTQNIALMKREDAIINKLRFLDEAKHDLLSAVFAPHQNKAIKFNAVT